MKKNEPRVNVYYNKQRNKWHARVNTKERIRHVGYFDTEDEARLKAERKRLSILTEKMTWNERAAESRRRIVASYVA